MTGVFKLYFKHLYPSFREWQEEPFAPWAFQENVLLSVLSFYESTVITEDFSLKEEVQCEVFMDSGAFAATSMGYHFDPYEVAEMHAVLQADFIVPLDIIILPDDSPTIVQEKIQQTLTNTEILLDLKPSGSEVIGPLQGMNRELITKLFDEYRSLGVTKFALGGLVFQPNLAANLERIAIAREITAGCFLHLFGKFLHPELLKLAIISDADAVDGYGYILSSIRGNYILNGKYHPVTTLTEEDISCCFCPICSEAELTEFTQGNQIAQYLLIQHNIHQLNHLKEKYLKEKSKIRNELILQTNMEEENR
jgi:tRNA-guanine family transglycosylase